MADKVVHQGKCFFTLLGANSRTYMFHCQRCCGMSGSGCTKIIPKWEYWR